MSFRFPDQELRRTAVQWMDSISDPELLDFLPQLVQVTGDAFILTADQRTRLLFCKSVKAVQSWHFLLRWFTLKSFHSFQVTVHY